MAVETLTENTTTRLPTPEWFTLQRVADRWTEKEGRTVSVDEVLHYESTGILKIAALSDNLSIYAKYHGSTNPSLGEEIEKNHPEAKQIRDKLKNNKACIIGGLIYPITDISNQLKKRDDIYFSHVMMTEREPLTIDFLYSVICAVKDIFDITKINRSNLRIGNFFIDEPPLFTKVNRSDLRITRQELHRFEEAHGIGKPAQLGQLQDMNEETKVKRLERALGALALGLAKDATKYRNGDGANISAIAATALKSIRQNEDDSRPRGYGETIIYNAISEAVKAVQKDRVSR